MDVVSGFAYKITGDGVAAVRGMRTQPANLIIKPGRNYTVIARAKRSGGLVAGNLTIDLLGTGIDTPGLVITAASLTTSYQRFTAQLAGASGIDPTPADLILRVFVDTTPTNAEFVLVDEVVIVEGSVALDSFLPDPAAGDQAFFLSEEDSTKEQGTWTQRGGLSLKGNAGKLNGNTNLTDFLLWTYAGYGFRLWAPKAGDRGIHKVYLDDVLLGEVDQFASSNLAAAPIFTRLDIPLGIHRVKLEAANRRNASSTSNQIFADELEVVL